MRDDGRSTKRARSLRQVAPASEQHAWEALRVLRKHGLPVRRQHPIDRYFVDFAIVSKKLVIELDGAAHAMAGRVERDRQRDAALIRLGWKVLHLPAQFGDSPDALLAQVHSALRNNPLSLAGEGG